MASILVVDDEQDILDVVERALIAQGHQVVTAADGREALGLLQAQSPDLAILDIVMPHFSGIQICRYMRTNPLLSTIPILFLTMRDRIEDKVAGFESGCDDYLTKPFHLQELVMRVDALLRSNPSALPTGRLSVGMVTVDPDYGQVTVAERKIELTPVEFELLYYLVSHVGEVIPSERLLQEVWGYPPGTGNPSLVRMHMLNLRRKIEENPRKPQYLVTVPRHGYAMQSPRNR